MEWSNMSSMDIRIKMKTMENEYEAIKIKINNLMQQLDELDIKYNKAQSELEKRMK